jgi:hypothetical protein
MLRIYKRKTTATKIITATRRYGVTPYTVLVRTTTDMVMQGGSIAELFSRWPMTLALLVLPPAEK